MENYSCAGWQNSKSENMYSPYIFETQDPSKLEDIFYGCDDATPVKDQDHHLSEAYTSHSDLDMVSTTSSTLQAMPTNSRSYDQFHDSASVRQSQLVLGGHSGESARNELVTCDMNVGHFEKSEKTIGRNVSDGSKKSGATADTFGHRTSIYRGVTRHRWTGRYEAHLWDKSYIREGQARKGRQVYLGGYEKEDKAAIAYDLAALKYWGPTATTNFPVSNYTNELEMMKNFTKHEFIASLRRKSSGFSRGASIYRGVTRHHQQGRWQARIGRVAGNKDLYLGTFATEEEAAEAYDIAAIKFRGANAVTNFELNQYDVEAIASSSLPVGATKRLKLSVQAEETPSLVDTMDQQSNINSVNSIAFDATKLVPASLCCAPFDTTIPNYHQNLLHQLHSSNATTFNASGSMSTAVTSAQLLSPPANFFDWPHYSY